MYSSFDIPDTFNFPCTRKNNSESTGTHLYNTYYQWVSIFLAVQAGLFYIPRCIWLIIEGGLMSYMVKGKTKFGLIELALFFLIEFDIFNSFFSVFTKKYHVTKFLGTERKKYDI